MQYREEPTFQPISFLPMLISIIDDTYENTEDQYVTLMEIEDKPYKLDNSIIAQIFKVYKEQIELLDVFEMQLKKWKELLLNEEQENQIKITSDKLLEIKKQTNSILEFANMYKDKTIEKLLAKDDAEVGLEFLLNNMKF